MDLSFATIGYGVAAVAYAFLAALLASSWRGRLPGVLLMLACFASALWAGVMAWEAGWTGRATLAGELMEIVQKGAWIAFLLVVLGYVYGARSDSASSYRRFAVAVLGCCVALLACAVAIRVPSTPAALRDTVLLATRIIGPGMLAIIGMLLVEHLYRNTEASRRWALKHLCLGLGAMFAFEFYVYSDALLFRRVDPGAWGARGFVATLIAPLVAVSAARNPAWSLDVFVSRQAVLHSTTLLGASVYLLGMAVAGYYIRYFGGSWGGLLQAAFLVGAGVLLVLMLFSGTLRARVKFFLSKHFFSYRYDYREEWLRFTRILSEGDPGGRLHERSIEAIAELVESPGGGLWLAQDGEPFRPAAFWNMRRVEAVEPRDGALARFMERTQWVLPVADVRRNPDTYPGLELPGWIDQAEGAWLIVPLVQHETLVGFVVLARSRARIAMNWEVNDLLKTAGRHAANYLAHALAVEALARGKQFESFNRMSAFVVHDLKNLVAQLSLLLSNAAKHRDNPEFQDDMLETVQNSVAKMNRILMQLRSGGLPVEKPVPVSLEHVVRRAIAAKRDYRPAPTLEVRASDLTVLASAERLERVIGHMVQNAIEATADDGAVRVMLDREPETAVVEIVDTGKGMSAEFIRDGLFKPFESTKSTGMGIGVYESREYLRELGGNIDVDSRPGHGSRFRVTMPLHQRADARPQDLTDEDAA